MEKSDCIWYRFHPNTSQKEQEDYCYTFLILVRLYILNKYLSKTLAVWQKTLPYVATSIATTLSFLFPQDTQVFQELAKECSESRFEGGVHFRTDNEVGLVVGNQVGEQVIKTFLKKIDEK